MPRLDAIIRELAGPLRAEGRAGYRDTTIIGTSIGDYARAWAARAQAAGLSEAHRARCAQVSALLAEYGRRDPQGRRQLAEEAQRLLAQLAGANGPAPARQAPPATPPPPRPAPIPQPAAKKAAPARPKAAAAKPSATVPPGKFLDQPLPVTGRGRGNRLAKLGITTYRELLYHLPREYVPVKRIDDVRDGERVAVLVQALSREQTVLRQRASSRLMRFALEVSDDSGRAWVTSIVSVPLHGSRAAAIMGSPVALNYQPGTRLLVEGTVKRAGRFIEIVYSDAQRPVPEQAFARDTLAPVYPLTEGVFQSHVRAAVKAALAQLPADLPDPLPESLRRQHGLPDLAQALRDIHWPATEAAKETALRRLAMEELLTLQLAMAQRKRELERPGSGLSLKPRGDVAAALEEVLPFSLTRAQQRVISEIVADMAADYPMHRLLQGDVGSGKTVVAAAALMVALQNGYQGAVMAPTELLAEQHYLVLSHLLSHFGVSVELLTGSLKASDRERAYARLADGRAQVAVGTHALIQEGVEFQRLGLVVVDEQHRFGVRQRATLRTKGEQQPDMLVMTATPIPRTLAMTVFGDLELSLLDELPPGRTPVVTRWVPIEHQEEAYAFVRKQVAEGRQVYVVCPLIEESEKLQAKAATELAEELRQGVFADLRVGLLHGAMKVAEKDAVMEAFRAGEIDVLTATTVVEVGVDVPNASVMVVLNAERFGLAQLHQLRGRVGRGQYGSYCLLLTQQKYDPTGRIRPDTEEQLDLARRRIQVLLEQNDGFKIAEEDLQLRGPGEFYGTRQHGLPDYQIARLVRDPEFLEQAREAAFRLIEQDPELRHAEHRVLRERVAELRARIEEVAA